MARPSWDDPLCVLTRDVCDQVEVVVIVKDWHVVVGGGRGDHQVGGGAAMLTTLGQLPLNLNRELRNGVGHLEPLESLESFASPLELVPILRGVQDFDHHGKTCCDPVDGRNLLKCFLRHCVQSRLRECGSVDQDQWSYPKSNDLEAPFITSGFAKSLEPRAM